MKAAVWALATFLFAIALAACGGGSSSSGTMATGGESTSTVRTASAEPSTPSRADLKAGANAICRRTLPILKEIKREIAADHRTVEVANTELNRFHLAIAYRRYSRVGQAEVARLQGLRGPRQASYGLFLVVNNMNPAFISVSFLGNSYERGFPSVIRETEGQAAEVRKKALEATRSFGLDICAREFVQSRRR